MSRPKILFSTRYRPCHDPGVTQPFSKPVPQQRSCPWAFLRAEFLRDIVNFVNFTHFGSRSGQAALREAQA
jgi:hypothetical protein